MNRAPSGHLAERLSALVDGELEPAEADRAHRHLAACDTCLTELRAVEEARFALRALPLVDLPDEVTDRVRWLGQGRPPRRVAVGAAVAAAAAAAVLVALAPPEKPVAPPVGRLVEVHATSGMGADPLSQMAPAVIPASFEER